MKINIKLNMTWFFIVTIVFTVLKLCSVIAWSWMWVLSPLWIGVLFNALILFIGLGIYTHVSRDVYEPFKSNTNTNYGRPLVWDSKNKELF